MFFKKLFREKAPQGYIGYFGIEDFWLNKLNDQQREKVKIEYEKGLNTRRESIDKIKFDKVTMSKPYFLSMLADYLEEEEVVLPLIENALISVKHMNEYEQHFVYMRSWKKLKKLLKFNPDVCDYYISILIKDCAIHERFNIIWKQKYDDTLPNYPAFKDLALMYERLGKFKEAMEISKDAIRRNVKETTSFERRIDKLEKRINK